MKLQACMLLRKYASMFANVNTEYEIVAGKELNIKVN